MLTTINDPLNTHPTRRTNRELQSLHFTALQQASAQLYLHLPFPNLRHGVSTLTFKWISEPWVSNYLDCAPLSELPNCEFNSVPTMDRLLNYIAISDTIKSEKCMRRSVLFLFVYRGLLLWMDGLFLVEYLRNLWEMFFGSLLCYGESKPQQMKRNIVDSEQDDALNFY